MDFRSFILTLFYFLGRIAGGFLFAEAAGSARQATAATGTQFSFQGQHQPDFRNPSQFSNQQQMGMNSFFQQGASSMAQNQPGRSGFVPPTNFNVLFQQRPANPQQLQASRFNSPQQQLPSSLNAQLAARGLLDPMLNARTMEMNLAQMQAVNQQAMMASANSRQLEAVLLARGMSNRQQMSNPEMAASQAIQMFHRANISPRQDQQPATYKAGQSFEPQAFRRVEMAGEIPLAAQFAQGNPYELPGPKVVVTYSKPLRAVAVVNGPFGISGLFNLSQSAADQPVEMLGRLSGVRPGDHGIHIHALGDLSRGCDSAGSHFNPEGNLHGAPEDVHMIPHAGDLGNLQANEYSIAEFYLTTPLISLYPSSPFFVIGRTLIIHDKPDDLGRGGDQASRENGNAGSRIACGVIGFAN